MDRRELNKLMMYRAIATLFKNLPNAWNQVAPLEAALEQFNASVKKITDSGLTQEERKTLGFTLEKNEKLQEAGKLAFTLKSRLRAYALANKRTALIETLDYPLSKLMSGTEEAILNRMLLIHKQCTDNQSEADGYQLTDDVLQTFKAMLDEVKTLTDNRENLSDLGQATTANLPALFAEVKNLLLPQLDSLVYGMVEDVEFLAAYKQARKIFDRRSGHGKREEEQDESED